MAKNQLKDKQPKSTTKTTPKSKEGKKQNKLLVAPPPESIVDDASGSGASGDDDDDDDDDGVDQEGMERLLKALGDDGLSEFDTAQLASLTGDADDEEEEDEGDEDEDENESGEDEEEDVSDEGSGSNDDEVEEEEEEEAGEKEKKAKTKKTQDKNLKASTNNGVDEDEDDEDEEEMLALDDLDAHSVDEDAILKRKTVINDELAMERIRDTIKLDSSLSWTETLTVTYPETIEVDHEDDLERELAFYKQALHGAEAARNLAAQHSLPWTRPSDYFAEMVKTDAHMERIRQRLLDEKADMKRGEQRKKEREGKKYGKQIQIEKIKEREKSKKEVEERLKALKRKRKDGMGDAEDGEAFDVAVEDALADRPNKKSRNGSGPSKSGPKMSRNRRDSKFGFGGQGKRSKQNTRESTENFDSGNKRHGGKGGPPGKGKKATKPQRLGKGRRQAARGRS